MIPREDTIASPLSPACVVLLQKWSILSPRLFYAGVKALPEGLRLLYGFLKGALALGDGVAMSFTLTSLAVGVDAGGEPVAGDCTF